MKKLLKSDLHTLAAALTLGTLSIGFSPAVMAISTYDASASFSLTLTDVTDADGAQVTSGWFVDAFGFGAPDFLTLGDATATGTASVVDPAVSLSIGSGITQSSTASGTATNGFAWTDTLTDLAIDVENTSEQALTFSFSYDVISIASATGDSASATATVDMLDDLGLVAIFAQAYASVGIVPLNVAIGDASEFGIIQFTLLGGEFNSITGYVDSIGDADAVPVPAAVWLFGSGLLGLVGVARRKQAA